MAYDPRINSVHQEAVAQEIVAQVFQKIIPASNRMWLQEGLKVEVVSNLMQFTKEIRISYVPTARVVPVDSIYLKYSIQDEAFKAVANGQYDLLDDGQLRDFFLKMLMVYSIEPYDFNDGNWGTVSGTNTGR